MALWIAIAGLVVLSAALVVVLVRARRGARAPAAPGIAEPARPSGARVEGLAARIRALFPGGGATNDTWKGLEEALIRADVGPRAAADVVARVKERYAPPMDPADVVVEEIGRASCRERVFRTV